MKNREFVVDVLTERINKEASTRGAVCLLSGPWGCGKSYLWLNDILPRVNESSVITISLFGLDSIETLKKQLMNKCLVLKGQSIKKGKVKDALSGSGTLLQEGLKTVLKGADSFFGTNLLSWNLDPLQLVDDKLIVCLDDFERMSPKVDLEEVLGLINFLAEHKKCNVLIIMHEHALQERGNSYAETMTTYKERVVDCYLQVEANIETSFDLFTSQYESSGEVYSYLIASKEAIIQAMTIAKCTNLRTLKKALEVISEIILYGKVSLEHTLIPSLVAFQIEFAEGKFRTAEFYNFDEMTLLMKNLLGKEDQGKNTQREERLAFHKKYFGSSEGYKFIQGFHDRFKYGYFDWQGLKAEINPEKVEADPIDSALAETQSREWWYLSDEEYEKWVETIKDQICSDKEISTYKLIMALVYLVNASKMSGRHLAPDIEKHIRERIRQNALLGDESFSGPARIFLSEQRNIWEPYLEGYNEIAQFSATKSLVPEILECIRNEDIEALCSNVLRKPKGLIAAMSEDSLLELGHSFTKNRRFFHDVVSILVDELCSYRGSGIVEDLEKKLESMKKLIEELLGQSPDNSAKNQLSTLLAKFPTNEAEAKSRTAQPEGGAV